MNSTRTLWMGNIEPWMDEAYVLSLFNSFDIYPIKINIKKKDQARGCCFVEMESHAIANHVLETLNGKRLNEFLIKLNWVNQKSRDHTDQQHQQHQHQNQNQQHQQHSHQHQQHQNQNQQQQDLIQQPLPQKKYTVYVGNLNKSIKSEELRYYFKEEYPSVISAKVIYDPLTQASKGFGFVDLLNYDEYQHCLYSKTIRTIRGTKIVINSTKSKKNDEANQDTPIHYSNGNYNNNNSNNNNNNNNTTHLQISHILSETNYKEYIPKSFEMQHNNSFIGNQSTCPSMTNLLTSNESNNGNNHLEDFALSLQRGFRDIAEMYRSSIVKPKISFQCNYYCNLNVMPNVYQNDDCFGENNYSQYIDAFAKNIMKNMNINMNISNN